MLTMFKDWKGPVEINGTEYKTIDDAFTNVNLEGGMQFRIKLLPKIKTPKKPDGSVESEVKKEVRIKVKKYMTQKASPEFDFMAKWNNNNPMPLRIMTGTIEKQTRGMYYMKLHGDMYAEQMCTCMKCGKQLTNKISQYVGLGPECGSVIHMSLTEADLAEIDTLAKEAKKRLAKVEWCGWIIKSSIIKEEEV